MYVPKHFEESQVSVLHALIKAHSLGTWVTQGDAELITNHVPFLLDPGRGENGTLVGHVARANPVWHSFSSTMNSVVVFQGPEKYITPSWYAAKQAHGKVVPTWNYAVVHAHGLPRAIHDREWLLDLLNRLTNLQEAEHAVPWKVADAPADFIERQLPTIVGIEIPIARLVGKWKVSQNRDAADKLGIVAGLHARDDEQSQQMAALVNQYSK